MFKNICIILAIAAAARTWCQVQPAAAGGDAPLDENTRMITPPAVTGANLPLDAEEGQRSNYLLGALTFNGAYLANVQPGITSASINDETYSIWPVLVLDQRSPRTARTITYSSGFTFYQRTNVLDSINQSLDGSVEYDLTPRLTVKVEDSLRQNSNLFNQPLLGTAGATSQLVNTPGSAIVIPFEEELKNEVSGTVSYQFAKFAMVGGKMAVESLSFPNLPAGSGLYNSRAESGLFFYSRRVSRSQYLGALYERARVVTSQLKTTTQTQTTSFFYTFYLGRNITLSLVAGPQYLDFAAPTAASYHKWTPSVRGNFGWQSLRTRLTVDYWRDITAGQGLIGAYASDSADASARFQLTRRWVFNSIAVYDNNKNSVPTLLQGYPGGHSASGTASLEQSLGEHLEAGIGYTRLHQSYSGIAEISGTPDSDRFFVSLSYAFRRPLGR